MVMEKGKETDKTPTPEEVLKSLTTQLEKANTELDGLKKGYATVQQTLAEKDRDLKRRTDVETQIRDLGDRVELLATAMATAGLQTDEAEELPREKRQDVLGLLSKQKQEQEAKRKQEEYFHQADVIHTRAEVAFAGDDEKLDRVEDLLMSMIPARMDRAESMVAKAEKALAEKTVVKESPKNTEDEIAKRLDEEKRKWLEEQGRLVAETSTPAGATGGKGVYSLKQIQDMPTEEYRKAFPTENSFREAVGEGRITQ